MVPFSDMRQLWRQWSQAATVRESLQVAYGVALLSVVLQFFDGYVVVSWPVFVGQTALLVVGGGLYLVPSWRRVGTQLFVVGLVAAFVHELPTAANHTWLAVWTLVPAAVIASWWTSVPYRRYLRFTLGLVMLAAAGQKLLAGTYLDGSYITWLSFYGSPTEMMFQFLCSPAALEVSCLWYRLLGTFMVAWQVAVGLLLLGGVQARAVLFTEIGFLLAAGVYADELNFQVLNIALLAIVFGYGMPRWLLLVCLLFLGLDMVGLGNILIWVW